MNVAAAFFTMVFLMLAAPVMGQEVSQLTVTFDIQPDLTVKQTMTYTFHTHVQEDLNYSVSGTPEDIEASSGGRPVPFTIITAGDQTTITLHPEEPLANLTLSFRAVGVVFTSANIHHFFADLSFEESPEQLRVSVILPSGYVVYKNSFRPAGAGLGSDGESISLTWEQPTPETFFISVKFAALTQPADLWLPVSAGFGVALIVIVFWFRRKTWEAFLRGFREDERRTVQYIEARGMVLQTDIEKQFHFSRAKTTRIVMKLAAMGLVRKQRYGRTNKLFWLKKAPGSPAAKKEQQPQEQQLIHLEGTDELH